MLKIKCSDLYIGLIGQTLQDMLSSIPLTQNPEIYEKITPYFAQYVMPHFQVEGDHFIGEYESELVFEEQLPFLIRYAYSPYIDKIALMIETGFAGKLSSEVSTNGSSSIENFSMNEDSPIDSVIDSITTPSEKNQHRGGSNSERKFHGNFDSRENIRFLLNIKGLQDLMIKCFKKIVAEYTEIM